MNKLGVNIDHVATLRQARANTTTYPDPIEAAVLCQKIGAASIVCHLREDRRHIQDNDVKLLRKNVKYLNLEMSTASKIIDLALKIKPNQVTLVPEKREELTTEGGLDVIKNFKTLRSAAKRFNDAGIKVSLFVDPIKSQIKASLESGAQIIEIHTGSYANAMGDRKVLLLEKIRIAAEFADKLGLYVSAGHGLHNNNTKPLTKIRQIQEYNIGHWIISRSVFVGIEKAVREMLDILNA